jgi:signal transduction histidine kinase
MQMTDEEPIISLNSSPFFRKAFHDLRNPLVVIKGYTSLMLEGCGGDLTEDQQEWVGDMKRNADHLLDIINALSELSFLEAGITTEKSDSFDVGEALRSVIADMESLAKNRDISLKLILPDRPVTQKADAGLVKKAMHILLHNALRFTGKGGTVEAALTEKKEVIALSVRDSGPGIEEGKIPAVLEGFFKGDDRGDDETKGTGLSLLIARRIAELYGGTIEIQSEPEKGSTFVISMKRGI